jgi:hypothetical protein
MKAKKKLLPSPLLLLSVALSFASPRFPFFVVPHFQKGQLKGGL